MDAVLEIRLAKAEAIKRYRAAVRLECSIAADYVINRNLPAIEAAIDREIAARGLPGLEAGTATKARMIADGLQAIFEEALPKLLELEASSDS